MDAENFEKDDPLSDGEEEIKKEKEEETENARAMSRSQVKRLQHKERLKSRRKEERSQRRAKFAAAARQAAESGSYVSKRDQRALSEARLVAAMQPDSGAAQVVIDCSLSTLMSAKEVEKLAMQIGRLYGANRRHENPVHLWLAGLEPDGPIERALKAKCDGFDAYKVSRTSKAAHEQFPATSLLYLTPDAPSELEAIPAGTVLVLGGLVDESPVNRATLSRAEATGLRTARLPLARHLHLRGPRAAILPLNVAGAMLLEVLGGGEWEAAIRNHMPARFVDS